MNKAEDFIKRLAICEELPRIYPSIAGDAEESYSAEWAPGKIFVWA